MDLRAYLIYRRIKLPLMYWRSKNGHEVDFLVGTKTAIEVKASSRVSERDFKGLKYLDEEKVFKNFIPVSQDPINTKSGKFQALHWEKFLGDLWADEFV